MDKIAPETMDEWVAFNDIDPDPEKRLRTILINGFMMLANAWGIQAEETDLDPVLKLDKAEQPTQESTPEQLEALMRTKYGEYA